MQTGPDRMTHNKLGCDVIVATAAPQDARVELDGIEPSALSFLNSETVTHWAERAIGF